MEDAITALLWLTTGMLGHPGQHLAQAVSKRGSASRALHRAEQKGHVIVAGDDTPAAVRGLPVEYAPRTPHDPMPWRSGHQSYRWFRLAGTSCKAVS
jgi:hypothetical protein